MKTAIRIAALMLLIVVSAIASDSGAKSSRPTCICPAIFDPHCDFTGRIFSNGCACQCLSPRPGTCERCGSTAQ